MNFDPKDDFIAEHMPFIVKSVAEFTKKYVEIENSEELSIAIEAFYLAMDKYEESRGAFFPFAKKVITNKLIDDARKKSKVITLQWDDAEIGTYEQFEEDTILKNELKHYESCLSEYGITFEGLTKSSPSHELTRKNIFHIAKLIFANQEMLEVLNQNKKLPITLISSKMDCSKKVLKTHKEMLIAIIVAYKNNISSVIQWIERH